MSALKQTSPAGMPAQYASTAAGAIRAGLLLIGRYGRSYCVLIGVSAGTNSVIAMFAGERGLTTGGFVIK